MMVMQNVVEYIQNIVGCNWTVKFENERLIITAEDVTEARLDPEQMAHVKIMGFDFETILVTGPITDVIFAPNGGLQ